jgi:SAM-dependent methyltransferase
MNLAPTAVTANYGLGARAASVGWQPAWFEFNLERIRRGEPLAEDDRAADWTLLLRLDPDACVMIIGCEWATAALALARRCSRVYVLDDSSEKVEFLKARASQQNVTNIECRVTSSPMPADFGNAPFDLIVIRDIPQDWPVTLPALLEPLKKALKPKGSIFLSVTNSWCPLFWLSRSAPGRFPTQSLFGCMNLFARGGFNRVQAFSPLPRHWGVSLFHLPLDQPAAIRFFFKKIFPLFDAVSPEVKRGFALEHALAKIAAKLACLPGAAHFVKYFLPGFHFIVQKGAQRDFHAA